MFSYLVFDVVVTEHFTLKNYKWRIEKKCLTIFNVCIEYPFEYLPGNILTVFVLRRWTYMFAEINNNILFLINISWNKSINKMLIIVLKNLSKFILILYTHLNVREVCIDVTCLVLTDKLQCNLILLDIRNTRKIANNYEGL